jgi:UPF0755 protein
MTKKNLFFSLAGLGVVVIVTTMFIYSSLFGLSVHVGDKNRIIYIPDNAEYYQVIDTLEKNLEIENIRVLKWVAKKKKYPALIKPGKYIIDKDLSYIKLIDILRSGDQTPVMITFNNVRTLNQIAGKISKYIEADSSQIISFLSDESNFASDGFTKNNIIGLFIPNTYQFFWNTDAIGFYNRMVKEYRIFWNETRLSKANEKGLDPKEVTILASIIDDEVTKADDKPRIAGVYLNRLKRGIPLQACPTIKFALNDFTITRVLKKHLLIESPYNTYKHKGFPPGPIGCPSVEGIDAVLNAEKSEYLFFAAKPDFSGYHNFSKTLAEHNRYAALYQKELNKRKIFK